MTLTDAAPAVSKSPYYYLNQQQLGCFYLSSVTQTEFENEINQLKINKSVGPYSIPVSALKSLRHSLSKPLEILFNLSFTTSTVPEQFQIAKVIPVFKTGSQTCVNNYRPISLLSIFNKLLEKLMYKRLLSYINDKKILYNKQFGFRTQYSTDFAIMSIVDLIQRAIDNQKYSCGIFLDFSKALDTVNHSILFNKLEHYGVRGITKDCFLSYLSNRKQFVSIQNFESEYAYIKSGVPQGTVLGPLLFLLYINDFSNCSKILDFHLFADDSNLFYRDKNFKNMELILNQQLLKVSTWLGANQLSLNVSKSNFVIFHPPQKRLPFKIDISINNNLLM